MFLPVLQLERRPEHAAHLGGGAAAAVAARGGLARLPLLAAAAAPVGPEGQPDGRHLALTLALALSRRRGRRQLDLEKRLFG